MSYSEKQLNLLIAAIALGTISLLATILRIISRRMVRGLGIDDYFMLVGEIIFIPTCVFAALSAESGAGRKDSSLATYNKNDVAKYIFLAEPFYVVSLVFVKTSICLTLLQIATKRRIRLALYVIIGLTVATNLITLVMVLSVCRPLQAAWIPMQGKCVRSRVVYCLYFISSGTLVTDYSCAMIPAVMLWNVQMNRRTKIIVALILSLGVVASTGTLIRLPYVHQYDVEKNRTYYLADLALWSIFECGLGIIAGSSAALKPLFGKFFGLMASSTADSERIQDVEVGRIRPFSPPKCEQISVSTAIDNDADSVDPHYTHAVRTAI